MRLVVEFPQQLFQLFLLLSELTIGHRLIIIIILTDLLFHSLDKNALQSALIERCIRELVLGFNHRQSHPCLRLPH